MGIDETNGLKQFIDINFVYFCVVKHGGYEMKLMPATIEAQECCRLVSSQAAA